MVNVVLVLAVLAFTIPSCIVPQLPQRPAHFAWAGLRPAYIIVGLVTFALWFRR